LNIGKYRVGIIVIILMLLLQIFTPGLLEYDDSTSKYSKLLDSDFRMNTSVDKTVLDAFIYHVKNEAGYKIVFVGDSVIQGATVHNNKNTIPAIFENLIQAQYPGKNIKVYNFSLQGNRSSDVYFTIKKLIENKAADMIISNINYAFYSAELLGSASIARPELFSDVMDSDSANRLGLKFSSVEHTISRRIISNWAPYASREEMSFFLFGSNPRKFLYDGVKNFRKTKAFDPNYKSLATPILYSSQIDKAWTHNKPFSKDKIKHWIEVFNVEKFDDNNSGYYFLKKTAQLAEDNHVKLITFFTPMNSKMIHELNLMQYGHNFQSNIHLIRLELANRKIPIYDYTNAIDSSEFNDLFHMITPGNRHTAGILFRDINSFLGNEVNK
jgi:hypothetical protein